MEHFALHNRELVLNFLKKIQIHLMMKLQILSPNLMSKTMHSFKQLMLITRKGR